MKQALTVNTPVFRMPPAPFLRVAAIAVIVVILAPSAAVAFGAFFGRAQTNALSAAALADYITQTGLYATTTIALALLIALPAAWLTVMRRFPGDRIITWALFMPLALPPYMTGYAYSHFMETTVGVQPGGVWAAAAVTSLAVYPYIYLFARAALRQQSRHIQSAARLMGYSPLAACRKISWPLARPAVIVGASLALMETLGDIAIAEHYGVRSLGFGVYDLWLNRDDMFSACRLAVLLMLMVMGILTIEEYGRRKQKHYSAHSDRRFSCENTPVTGVAKYCHAPLLFLPAAGGFFLPVGWFVYIGLQTRPELWRAPFLEGLGGSLLLSFSVAAVLLSAALVFCADKRQNKHGALITAPARLSCAGYALPGAVLAQGFFLLTAWTGGSMIQAGIGLVVLACAARFFIIAVGATETGLAKISPQLDAAAKLAKQSAPGVVWRVHIPLMRPALAMGALMVFLETIKELPLTLILRPLNFNTLATVAYQYASDESLALAAPAVIATALIAAVAVSVLFWMEEKNLRHRAR